MTTPKQTYCGYIALIGRPNVGKSTLLNRLIGQKISITSRKPQTTRHRLLGIKTIDDKQFVYVDTPGLHSDTKRHLNQMMNRAASYAISDVDVIIFLVDSQRWTEDDDFVLKRIKNSSHPIILAINKVDTVKDKQALLPVIEKLKEKANFAAIFPISAKLGTNVDELEKEIAQYLPQNPFFFLPDQITDREERFIISEIIREKLFRATGQELPYSATVVIEQFKLIKGIYHIAALIFVEREGQKIIVIGKKGEKLKEIGRLARLDIEKLLEHKVFLQLWIKVKSGWADDAAALRELGYGD